MTDICFLCFRVTGVTPDQEQSLLQQLTEITRVMQEGQLVDGFAPEKIQNDWNGTGQGWTNGFEMTLKPLLLCSDYHGDQHQYWEPPHCCCQHRSEAQVEGDHAQDGGEDDKEASSEKVSTPAANQTPAQERELTMREENCHKPECADPGIPEQELEEELELRLKVTSMKEQENSEKPQNTTDRSCSSIRRRNKRRRTKKAAH